MQDIRSKWLAFYTEHVEHVSKEMFSHVEKMIVATLIISAGAHVSSTDPAILLFGYLRRKKIDGIIFAARIIFVFEFRRKRIVVIPSRRTHFLIARISAKTLRRGI